MTNNSQAAVARGPSVLLQGATVFWAAPAALVSARTAPGLLGFAVAGSGFVLGVWWCFAALFARERRLRAEVRLDARGRLAWAFCPAVGLLMTALVLSRLPLAARVYVFQGSLRAVAEEALALSEAGDDLDTLPRAAGTFRLRSVVVQDGAVFFVNALGLGSAGLLYVPQGREPPGLFGGEIAYCDHLFGRWWHFSATF